MGLQCRVRQLAGWVVGPQEGILLQERRKGMRRHSVSDCPMIIADGSLVLGHEARSSHDCLGELHQALEVNTCASWGRLVYLYSVPFTLMRCASFRAIFGRM